MIYDSYTKTDAYYELTKGNEKLFIPATATVIVDDESGLLSFKAIGTRKTIALVKNNSNNTIDDGGNGSGGGYVPTE